MTTLLELRERAMAVCSAHENVLTMAGKFLLAFVSLLCINARIGFNPTLSSPLLAVVIALVCALLPTALIVVAMAFVVMGQMYTLSMETAIVAAVIFLLLLLLYFRFAPKDAAIILLLPICFLWNIPYVIPLAAGLLLTPASVVSVTFGLVISFFIQFVADNATSITGVSTEEIAGKFRFVADGVFQNQTMFVMIAAFALSLTVVYMIRRLVIANAWLIASVIGSILNLLVILIGDMMFDTKVSVGFLFLGTILSFLIAWVIQFFAFNLDYSRTESVQFEDDDYYYYVKAVPKVTVSTKARTVKKISASREIAHPYARGRGGEYEEYDEEPQEYADSYEEDYGDSYDRRGMEYDEVESEDWNR
ncbi:MAG: hypothetical protein Q4C60_04940 [Eubacteriales bacterium]|nr:hypothetical protein [Eubacteriales bacterium]